MNGAKGSAEVGNLRFGGGRGAFLLRRSSVVRQSGATGSENAGMSSDSPGKIPGRRKPKVSSAMSIS